MPSQPGELLSEPRTVGDFVANVVVADSRACWSRDKAVFCEPNFEPPRELLLEPRKAGLSLRCVGKTRVARCVTQIVRRVRADAVFLFPHIAVHGRGVQHAHHVRGD